MTMLSRLFGKKDKLEDAEPKNLESINYSSLRTKEEREFTFNNITSSLIYRIADNTYLRPLIVNDETMNSITEILKRLNDVVIVIWKDDLYPNHTYFTSTY